eukprot:CAMPEP_0185763066 /NCGR_PEP_ID=MMETSP1174-20130828/22013_1 /TAXON_ID=35687 /ORGANISM="Dictyocha speculum, Strain CCMP1381" /LENGTH=194 /DNA_ID=CAMNT_0028445007 /DNA_START=745 /DNA_END=1331 /DNA_ORIENTATION=-
MSSLPCLLEDVPVAEWCFRLVSDVHFATGPEVLGSRPEKLSQKHLVHLDFCQLAICPSTITGRLFRRDHTWEVPDDPVKATLAFPKTLALLSERESVKGGGVNAVKDLTFAFVLEGPDRRVHSLFAKALSSSRRVRCVVATTLSASLTLCIDRARARLNDRSPSPTVKMAPAQEYSSELELLVREDKVQVEHLA